MSARDPVTVLREAAALLSPGRGRHRLYEMAILVAQRRCDAETIAKSCGLCAGYDDLYTPDERAAFALAREALAPVAGVEVER